MEPILTVELKSKASGEIIELPIEEGDIVDGEVYHGDPIWQFVMWVL